VDVADAIPDVLMDPVQIGVVLRNLIANGLEAASHGGPPREVRLRGSKGEGVVLIEVLDSGSGVSEDRLTALFEPGASEKPGGMGVGLSICRAIVEAHGGSLWARAVSSGHFCFTLPIDEAAASGMHRAP
jgi:two-component system, LuxR family, sensor kinase FixL